MISLLREKKKGIAYKEMGLLDDAIAEFLLTGEGDLKSVESRHLLGLCYMEQGDYQLAVGELSSALNYAVAFGLTFVLALVIWALASRLVRMLLHATPLQPVDRVLGGCFGLARGAVLLLAVTTVVLLTPAQRTTAWQHSQGAVWLAGLLQGLKPMLPDGLARQLPT